MEQSTSSVKDKSFNWAIPVKAMLILTPLILVAILWFTDTVKSNNLLLEVPQVKWLPWLESHSTYLYLHLFTFLPVFALSFDKNVHYYKNWNPLLPAIVIMATIFILWDVFFTIVGVWGFNHNYLTGLFILQLPIEEWLFFITVPFACIFIYECLNYYIREDVLFRAERIISFAMIVLFLAIGFFNWGRMYTATTFMLTGFFILYHVLFLESSYRSRFYLAFLVSLIPFLMVNGVLTGGYTQEPVVIYNPEEYLGIRVTSVPIEDAVYGFLLLFGTVTLYEKFRKK